ncbi:hypothetical protein A2U01_0064327, partial [Trifolium medium]|nr:hypothetical protein [Trifolium medium]
LSKQSNELRLDYCGCTVYYMLVAAGSERRHVVCNAWTCLRHHREVPESCPYTVELMS